ncbi:MAG: hypothetical protein ABSG93_12705 [Solirubrobacteraceae bacterium]
MPRAVREGRAVPDKAGEHSDLDLLVIEPDVENAARESPASPGTSTFDGGTRRAIRGTATEIQIGVADGMPIECALVLANTFSAEKVYLTKHITTLNSVRMSEVCRILAWTTGC